MHDIDFQEIFGMSEKKQFGSCETCVFYDYDEEYDAYECQVNLDQDELSQFLYGKNACPFYRFYDEYKSVQKQN